MVASTPYRWLWDIDKDIYFKVKDIISFDISKIINSENVNKYYVRCHLTNKSIVTIYQCMDKQDAINYIENFIKEPV